MRYLPLTDADRASMLRTIGAPDIDALFVDVPEAARLSAPIAGLSHHMPEMLVERHLGALAAKNMTAFGRAVLRRRGGVQAPRPGVGRPHHPARRVPDQLHAVPARDRAGHAAGPVRVPDAGRAADRHGGRQCEHVRWLDGDDGGRVHGAASHPPDQGAGVERGPSALRQRAEDADALHRRRGRHANPRLHPRRRPRRTGEPRSTRRRAASSSRTPTSSATSPTSPRSPPPATRRARC